MKTETVKKARTRIFADKTGSGQIFDGRSVPIRPNPRSKSLFLSIFWKSLSAQICQNGDEDDYSDNDDGEKSEQEQNEGRDKILSFEPHEGVFGGVHLESLKRRRHARFGELMRGKGFSATYTGGKMGFRIFIFGGLLRYFIYARFS
ncbi:MAG: hypothetical protein R2747_14565 [Pyrinomonadaceae bacterium]